jgi:signal transduction histidine kinase
MTNQYFESNRLDFDSSLINYAIDLSDHLSIDESGVNIVLKVPESEDQKNFPFVLSQTFYSIRDLKGYVLSRSIDPITGVSPTIPYDPSLPLKQDYTHRLLGFKVGDDFYRAVNLKITTSTGKEMILQVGTIHNSIIDRENKHLLMTFLMVPLFMIASSIFSFLLAGNALTPIKTLTDSANNIAAQNLSLRVPVVDTGDEIEELARTLNHLLERLEKSFEAQENFVSNASHQLNTPLAIIKGELDVLQSKERSPEEIQKFHQSLREELQRLIELVKNMLLISRVKSGVEKFVFSPLRLDDLLLTTISRLRFKAREKKITIRYDIDEELNTSDLQVMGEKQLLDTVFENLLDNAIKYSPEESTVELRLKKMNGLIEVWLSDEGPGMEKKDFEQIIKTRFQRASRNISGTGLGLSLANKIAGFHSAKIDYEPLTPKGSLFKVIFSRRS